MKWVKCIDRLPEDNRSYFVIGKMGRGSIPFKDGIWGADHPHMRVFEEIIEWLDEEQVSFNLEEIEDAFLEGRAGYYTFKEYMKEEYKIDTP